MTIDYTQQDFGHFSNKHGSLHIMNCKLFSINLEYLGSLHFASTSEDYSSDHEYTYSSGKTSHDYMKVLAKHDLDKEIGNAN